MIEYVIGNYFVEKGLITRSQYQSAIRRQADVKVQLGTIAISEGLMTQAQADAVNSLQQSVDKRFGDIAIDKEFLTPAQVKSLLKEQGNPYIMFMQTLADDGIMSVDAFEKAVKDYQYDEGLTTTQIESMKSDSISAIVGSMIPDEMSGYLRPVSTGIRLMTRLVDRQLYISHAYITDLSKPSEGIYQHLTGAGEYTDGLIDISNGFYSLAKNFAKGQYEESDAFDRDAVGELLNCINGLYATTLSREGTEYEISPQEYIHAEDFLSKVSGRQMLHIPVSIDENKAEFVIVS